MDKEIEKKVINCSRCGLCMEICPVYLAKKTETSVLRGKFLQLLGIIRGDLKMDKKIAYNLDLCLACGKCKKACPSNIDAVEIFANIKAENLDFFEKIFYSRFSFKLKLFFLSVLYKIKHIFKKPSKKISFGNEKIAYFKGCASRALNSNLFLEQEKFKCCGLPFYVKGKFKTYEKYKNKNLKLIEKYDKVIFDCATCYDAVSNYEGVDKNKLVYFTDFYKNKKLKSKIRLKVAFHKPCHLSNEKFIEIEQILKNIENVEYVQYKGMDDCCGFGGDFFTRHIKTASILSVQKIENILSKSPNCVITTCPSCLWSLKYGIKAKKAKLKALDLAEFLSTLITD